MFLFGLHSGISVKCCDYETKTLPKCTFAIGERLRFFSIDIIIDIISVLYKPFSEDYSRFCGLPKEQIADKDCCNNSCCIGYQTARNGMAGLGDSYTAEIYGQHIKGGIGRTLEDTSQSANE